VLHLRRPPIRDSRQVELPIRLEKKIDVSRKQLALIRAQVHARSAGQLDPKLIH
jgi:hypothetical protein